MLLIQFSLVFFSGLCLTPRTWKKSLDSLRMSWSARVARQTLSCSSTWSMYAMEWNGIDLVASRSIFYIYTLIFRDFFLNWLIGVFLPLSCSSFFSHSARSTAKCSAFSSLLWAACWFLARPMRETAVCWSLSLTRSSPTTLTPTYARVTVIKVKGDCWNCLKILFESALVIFSFSYSIMLVLICARLFIWLIRARKSHCKRCVRSFRSSICSMLKITWKLWRYNFQSVSFSFPSHALVYHQAGSDSIPPHWPGPIG